MTSLNDSLFDWEKDYVNLKYEFLDERGFQALQTAVEKGLDEAMNRFNA